MVLIDSKRVLDAIKFNVALNGSRILSSFRAEIGMQSICVLLLCQSFASSTGSSPHVSFKQPECCNAESAAVDACSNATLDHYTLSLELVLAFLFSLVLKEAHILFTAMMIFLRSFNLLLSANNESFLSTSSPCC